MTCLFPPLHLFLLLSHLHYLFYLNWVSPRPIVPVVFVRRVLIRARIHHHVPWRSYRSCLSLLFFARFLFPFFRDAPRGCSYAAKCSPISCSDANPIFA
ncbi:hypothetical protein H4582DRAFT_1942953 [Lactarius indigo]|nr:hypothetical protein H4582DRAFT_2036754 [Lactarius indigo]KAI9439793.1 hypothetical protein H4582DRAFT_1942953 [Lactarius indigo]